MAAAIAAFRANRELDADGEQVLARLLERERESNDVGEAFATIPRDRWNVVFDDCISGERVMRELITSGKTQTNFSYKTQAADDADRALKTIQKYLGVSQIAAHPDLFMLAQEVAAKRRFDKFERAVLPRKRDVASARSRGIGWIKESVALASGNPNLRAVATIAEAALGMGEITIEAVKKATTPRDLIRKI
jgi:hypothetical protein